MIRKTGMPNAVIAHDPDGAFDRAALRAEARRGRAWTAWTSCRRSRRRSGTTGTRRAGRWSSGYGRRDEARFHVVAVDYGVKRNILRLLSDCGCAVTVVPATATRRRDSGAEAGRRLPVERSGRSGRDRQIRRADDPGAARDAIAAVRHLPRPPDARAGGRRAHDEDAAGPSRRQPSGEGLHHRQGRNRVDEPRFRRRPATLPANVAETHVSLFDGSNCGIALTDRPAFSVQHHPEASPGPRDSHYLFRRFVDLMGAAKAEKGAA